MLVYRHVLLMVLACSMIIITLALVLSLLSFWLVFGLILVNLGILIGGSFRICSGLYLNVLCRGAKTEKNITLTFDDGPTPGVTPQVLDILKEHKITACFFVIGQNIEGNEAILERILAEGHIIGNHSYSHTNNYGFLKSKSVKQDLIKNAALIENQTGKKVNLIRPPFGVTNPNIAKAVRSLEYTSVGWSIRSLDVVHKNTHKTTNRVVKRLIPGGIVLFHDNHEGIFTILENVIDQARKASYKIIPLDEMLNIKTYK
jgi:peptidoglycan/xylan/chitin deacetylase (PgdA/CDA1 family)